MPLHLFSVACVLFSSLKTYLKNYEKNKGIRKKENIKEISHT